VAFLALVRAARNFDPSLGFSFGTYAGRVIWSSLRKEAYISSSQMKRPAICLPRPDLELKQSALGDSDFEQREDEAKMAELRDWVEWVLNQCDEQQAAVVNGILDGKTYAEIKLPRRHGSGKATPQRVAYVKKQLTEMIRAQEFDNVLGFIQRRLSDADLCDLEKDAIQDGGTDPSQEGR